MGLTARHRKVAEEYLRTGNKTRSYWKFFPTCKDERSASVGATKLFKKPYMRDYLEERMKEIDEEEIADTREILRGLTRTFRREEIHYETVTIKIPLKDEHGNIIGVEEKAKVIKTPTENRDAIKAGELLGKRYGLWTDKIDMDIDVPTIISGADELED